SVRTSTQTIVGQVASDFAGDIDEVFVFSRALSAEEIDTHAPPPPADGPVMPYDTETVLFDGRMKDLSGHVNHGTMTGTTDVAGKVGRARNFDGSGDRITAPAKIGRASCRERVDWFGWTADLSTYDSGIQGGRLSWELRVRAE